MSPMLKALLAVKERGYNPPGPPPLERLALISDAERRLLKRLGGAGRLTKSGIPSFYMEGSTTGKREDAKPSQSKTTTASKTSTGTSGRDDRQASSGTSSRSNTSVSSSNSRTSTGSGTSGRDDRQPSSGTSSNSNNSRTSSGLGRGINTPTASGSPSNNPTRINAMNSMQDMRNKALQRATQAAMAVQTNRTQQLQQQYNQFRSPTDFPYAGAEDLTRDEFNRVQAGADIRPQNYGFAAPSRPRSITGQVKDQSRLPQEITSPINYGERLQNALVQQQASIKALNAARANPDYADLSPQDEVPTDIQPQNYGFVSPSNAPRSITPRPGFSQAQFGKERLAPGAMYSNANKSASALRSVVNGINLMGGTPETKINSMLSNMGYSNKFGRAAAIGRFGVETADFDPDVFSGKRMGDKGTAFGLAQWRGPRQKAAKAYSKQMGLNPSDVAGQAAFAGTEMANDYPGSFNKLQGATSLADAMRGMNSYEAPRGYKKGGNPKNVSGYREAMRLAQAFSGDQPTRVAGLDQRMIPSIVAPATRIPIPRQRPMVPSTVAPATRIPIPRQKPATRVAAAEPTITPAGWSLNDIPGVEKIKTTYNNVNENVLKPIAQGVETYGQDATQRYVNAKIAAARNKQTRPTRYAQYGNMNRRRRQPITMGYA